MIFSPHEMPKFYDQECQVWRESMNSFPGQPYSEASALVIPTIEVGSKFVITQYMTNKLQDGFSITVFGGLENNEATRNFVQVFTLSNKHQRYFITTDTLKFISTESKISTNPNVELVTTRHSGKPKYTNNKSKQRNYQRKNE